MDVEAIARACAGRRLGHRVLWREESVSTNRELIELADAGDVEEGTVMLAGSQTGGKGRAGRSWYSPSGVNIYLSVLLGSSVTLREAPLVPFAAGVSLARTVEAAGFSPKLKWPNDLLLGGRKVAGLLGEMKAEEGRIRYLVVGVGLNVNMEADSFPVDLAETATSLRAESGRSFEREPLAVSFLSGLEAMLFPRSPAEGDDSCAARTAGWLEHWARYDACWDRLVRVESPEGIRVGTGRGIRPDGALLVRLEDGSLHGFTVGDVELLRVKLNA